MSGRRPYCHPRPIGSSNALLCGGGDPVRTYETYAAPNACGDLLERPLESTRKDGELPGISALVCRPGQDCVAGVSRGGMAAARA